jgi:hypothetical protein
MTAGFWSGFKEVAGDGIVPLGRHCQRHKVRFLGIQRGTTVRKAACVVAAGHRRQVVWIGICYAHQLYAVHFGVNTGVMFTHRTDANDCCP